MGRRDFIVLWLQALFLALFPWLRTEEGLIALAPAVESMVPTASADLAAFTAILKEKYSQATVHELFYAQNPFFAMVPKG